MGDTFDNTHQTTTTPETPLSSAFLPGLTSTQTDQKLPIDQRLLAKDSLISRLSKSEAINTLNPRNPNWVFDIKIRKH